jgi:FeS assembly SUF system protein
MSVETETRDRPAEVAPETVPPAASAPTEAAVVEALKTVYDPEIPVDIYELGLIYDIAIEAAAGKVAIKMTLTAPGCPVAGSMPQMVQDAIRAQVPGVNEVDVELVWDPPWDFTRMSEAARLELNMF